MRLSLIFCIAAIFAATDAMAGVVGAAVPRAPDSGQIYREGRPNVPQEQLREKVDIPEEEIPVNPQEITGDREFFISRVELENPTEIDSALFDDIIAEISGKDVNLTKLLGAASKMTAKLRREGFMLARVILPAQSIDNETVRFILLPGSYNEVNLENISLIDNDRVREMIEYGLPSGQPIRRDDMERTMLLVGDLYGSGFVKSTFSPGEDVGSTRITVQIPNAAPYSGYVMFDAMGSKYTGRNRITLGGSAYSPTGVGDRFHMSLMRTEYDMESWSFGYDRPLGLDGLMGSVYASSSTYELGSDFRELEATGKVLTYGTSVTYPFYRSMNKNVRGLASFEHRIFQDEVGLFDLDTKKNLDVVSFGVFGDFFDTAAFGRGARTDYSLTAHYGRLDIDSHDAREIDRMTLKTDGDYGKYSYTLSRAQFIMNRLVMVGTIRGQRAFNNLDSSERMSLGGPNGVRAFPQGEGVGDDADVFSLEAQYAMPWNLELKAFYDYGASKFNKDPIAKGPQRNRISGYGVGTRWRKDGFLVSVDVAWKDKGKVLSEPDYGKRIWLQAGYIW